jgi:hypothetical protein
MKKIFATVVLSFFTFSLFSKDFSSTENLNSEFIFSLSLDSAEQLTYEEVETDYFQIRNMVRRHHGCWNKYYRLGVYTYEKNIFEILQCTNGYSVFTYLVLKEEKEFPRMLLIDMRTGDQKEVSFKINKGLVYLSYIERCGEFPITISETYSLDSKFSAIKYHDMTPHEEINIITE